MPGRCSDLNRVSWDAWAAVHGQDTYYDSAVRGRFDLAYATIGILCWIDDVGAWMRSVAGVLRPGGRLLLIDGHPMGRMVEQVDPLVLAFPYANDGPHVTDGTGCGSPAATVFRCCTR